VEESLFLLQTLLKGSFVGSINSFFAEDRYEGRLGRNLFSELDSLFNQFVGGDDFADKALRMKIRYSKI